MSRTTSLSGELTIVNIAAMREQLLQALPASDPHQAGDAGLLLDLAGVELIDSAGIQLLLAAQRSLAQQELQLVLTGVPPVVAEAIDVFGLRSRLMAGQKAPT